MSTAGAVDCSVLMPVLNEECHIAAAVAAMRSQLFDGQLEFLLVDGGSTDRTPELLAELAAGDDRIRLLRTTGATPSGLNVALGQARGRWVARMDAHTEYPENYLALGVERLQDGDTRWVSGPQVPKGHNAVSRGVALALRSRLGRGASRRWGSGADQIEQGESELDSGVFAGVWDRQTLLEYGGWDERWTRNQDSEMAGRFLANGERLVCLPAMAAHYVPRGSLGGLWRQYLQYGEYRELTALRHPHTMRRSHLLAPALVVAVLAGATGPRPLRRLARAGLVVYAAAIVGAGIQTIPDAPSPGDAALVPVALAVMHLAHGTGAWRAAFRHGFPLSAMARVLSLHGLAARLAPAPEPVFAPSLQERSPAHEQQEHRAWGVPDRS